MHGHKLAPEYLALLERFSLVFPAAYEFLKRIEIEGPDAQLWLSTAVNAHLYKADAFLAYLKLKNPEMRPPSLVISPKYNQRIAEGTRDESARLFPRAFEALLTKHRGQSPTRWATRLAGGVTELGAGTPPEFFSELHGLLVAI